MRAHYSGLPAAASVAQAILTAQALILKEYERARSQPPSAP
ncbi:MAG TPA: hypothetical protein VEB59_00225 [Gemmatimonadales bacterium]|nr:hypothetical protein [Gemmatimonadales bacterium]